MQCYCISSKLQLDDKGPHQRSFPDCALLSLVNISVSSIVKNLGVIFDSLLNMDHQVRNITKSCYHQLQKIGRIRPLYQKALVKPLYAHLWPLVFTTAMPYYTVYVPVPCQDFTAARIITGTRKYDHITPVLVKLHWLPIKQRIQYKLILQFFKALHGTSPFYIQELVQVYKPNRSLRSESSMHLVQSRARTRSYGDRRFDVASSTLWNNLPQNLRLEGNFIHFKKLLKTYLFR